MASAVVDGSTDLKSHSIAALRAFISKVNMGLEFSTLFDDPEVKRRFPDLKPRAPIVLIDKGLVYDKVIPFSLKFPNTSDADLERLFGDSPISHSIPEKTADADISTGSESDDGLAEEEEQLKGLTREKLLSEVFETEEEGSLFRLQFDGQHPVKDGLTYPWNAKESSTVCSDSKSTDDQDPSVADTASRNSPLDLSDTPSANSTPAAQQYSSQSTLPVDFGSGIESSTTQSSTTNSSRSYFEYAVAAVILILLIAAALLWIYTRNIKSVFETDPETQTTTDNEQSDESENTNLNEFDDTE